MSVEPWFGDDRKVELAYWKDRAERAEKNSNGMVSNWERQAEIRKIGESVALSDGFDKGVRRGMLEVLEWLRAEHPDMEQEYWAWKTEKEKQEGE